MHTVSTRPTRATEFNELPERLAAHLRKLGYEPSFQYALKTAVKPDATVPILWAALTTEALLLCSTLTRRCIWKEYRYGDINSVSFVSESFSHSVAIEIISTSVNVPDLLLPLPVDTNPSWTEEFMACYLKLRRQSTP